MISYLILTLEVYTRHLFTAHEVGYCSERTHQQQHKDCEIKKTKKAKTFFSKTS